MRMRKRRNLEPRMERCAEYLISDPEQCKGKWRDIMPGCSGLLLELGCGKGRFTADLAESEPQKLVVALERVPDAMIIAMERAKNRSLSNVRFIDGNAAVLDAFFAPEEVDGIFINFCDPWPKSRDAKLRLTAPSFLRKYCDILPAGGKLFFKTDNTPLFDWSVSVLEKENWQISDLTHDLHANGPVGIMTDYEAKFYSEGLKINRLVASKTAGTLGTSAGTVPRLKDASLTDARGYSESRAAFESRKEQT